MADEEISAQTSEDSEYEPPTVTTLGTVRELSSYGEITEVPK